LFYPFFHKYIIHTLNMIVNNKCELIIKNHSRTLGGGTRNHQPSLQIAEKTPKILENLH